MSKIWIGTSGYNYPEWRGSFYPDAMPTGDMLPYYAARFSTVEINYTFYQMPSEKTVAGWAKETPDGFSFTLKAPRRITHDQKLVGSEENVRTFCQRAQTLGSKLGVLLFQLSPWHRKDLATFDTFLATLPQGTRAAFEFRNNSWLSDDVYARLRDRNLALCVSDNEKSTTPIVATADYGYFRLRDEGYKPADITRWGDTIMEQASSWKEVFIYFKHEESGIGPEFANILKQHLKVS